MKWVMAGIGLKVGIFLADVLLFAGLITLAIVCVIAIQLRDSVKPGKKSNDDWRSVDESRSEDM